MKKVGDTKKAHKMAKVVGCLGIALVLIRGILIVASSDISIENNAADRLYCRPELPDGKPHTDNLEIPVASQSSYPDSFDPASDCDGVLTQRYIKETEFGCAEQNS